MASTTSDAARREKARALQAQGFSEADAVKQAYGTEDATEADAGVPPAGGSESVEANAPVASPGEFDDTGSDRSFIIYTKDFTGLGWAKKLSEEGETVSLAVDCPEDKAEDRKLFEQVGKGWLNVISVTDALKQQDDNTYNVFAENCFTEEAEKLRSQGRKVFGTSTLSERMEHDRAFGVQVAEEAGLPSPPTEEFTTLADGCSFLDENPDTAYVFKPDDGKFNYLTFVPAREEGADANRELYNYLAHMKKEPGSFILQERIPRKDCLEVNVEAWIYEGEPFLATLGLELKRKDTGDIGEMAGCAGDFMQVIPLDCPLVQQTIGKLLPFYKEEGYTGTADVNVIITPDGQPHFLEVCNRFGYNAHVTMFLGLAEDGFGQLIADYTDGNIEGMYHRFRTGVAGSLTVFLDHPREGLPIHIEDSTREQLYLFDGYMEDDTLLLTGYSNEVGILVTYGKDIVAAANDLYAKIAKEAVSFPDMYYRKDIGDDDYPNAPAARLRVLHQRGLL